MLNCIKIENMKRFKITSVVAIVGLMLTVWSFELKGQSNWEIGARFGNSVSLDVTIPFKAPRLHPALYFGNNFSFGTYFDWLFSLEGDPYGLKFYPGVGPEFYFNNGFDVAAAGNFGIEYSFQFPLTIGFDWRPHFMLTDAFRFSAGNWGIFARFRIGQGVKFVKADQ